METPFVPALVAALDAYGFRPVANPSKTIPGADLLLKRQTWNTNRAVVVVSLPELPTDFRCYVRQLRRQVAWRCGFFPLFYGIGVQAIIVAPGIATSGVDPSAHVARIDNQWAIIQSLFLVDPLTSVYLAARTWGQFITGKFQDAIVAVLDKCYPNQARPEDDPLYPYLDEPPPLPDHEA